MRIGVTGASGFLGRYIVAELVGHGHHVRAWFRPSSDRSGPELSRDAITWVPGRLGDAESARTLVEGCDAVIHAALDRPGRGFRGAEGDLPTFVETNVVGTIRIIEAARAAGVGRFVFLSTGAVHERILDDRPLDEDHPTRPTTHYGASKAAIEAFVQSYGLGLGDAICALRPTGIYGLAHPARESKWFDLIKAVARGEDVECRKGGKEVHAADVARAAHLLLSAEGIAGESYNCYDRYVSEFEVASIARQLSGAEGAILGSSPSPKYEIVTAKLRSLGMEFGGRPLLERTIQAILDAPESD